MNNPEQINEERVNVAQWDEMTQQCSDELTEVGSVELEKVCGGTDGTAVGVA